MVFALLLCCTVQHVEATELTAQELRGKRIYAQGESESGTPLSALIARSGAPLPASIVPCGGCHGADGQGRPEGGVVPPDITWSSLTNSYGHDHDYGRSHPSYDEQSLADSIVDGIDPADNVLDSTMPRYAISADDLADLIAYIKRLEFDLDTGMTEKSIRIGTMLPLEGPRSGLGATMRAVLEGYFSDVNAHGGINGRRLELVVAGYDDDPTYAGWSLRDLLEQQSVFALVSGFVDGIEQDVAELVEETEIPIVGPYTMLPEEGAGLNRYSFYLLSGIRHHAELLMKFAPSVQGANGSNAAVVYRGVEPYAEFAAAASAAARPADWQTIQAVPYEPASFDAVAIASKLQRDDVRSLFFFGRADELKALTVAAGNAGWIPFVFTPSSLAAHSMFEIPSSFNGKVFVAYPSVPGDHTAAGVQAFELFHETHDIDYRYSAAQISAYTAATILVEGLKRSGRSLSRERLVAELEGLTDFRTGLLPPISFNQTRRIGALGGYVMALDPAARQLLPAGNWIALEH